MEGKIDRVDLFREDGQLYVRVIDYKTGKKEFRLSDLLCGLNMQMLLYLAALAENGEERYGAPLLPAGVLYMPSTEPLVNGGRSDSAGKSANRTRKSAADERPASR